MWTEVCKNCWNLFRFWWHQVFSITSLSVFWCVLWTCLYFLDIGFCNIGWGDLPLKCNFSCYVFASSSPALAKVVTKYLLITSDNQLVLFQSFVLTVFWGSNSYTPIIVFWMMLRERANAPARWWPYACLNCVSRLRRLVKNRIIRDAFLSLTWCSFFVET